MQVQLIFFDLLFEKKKQKKKKKRKEIRFFIVTLGQITFDKSLSEYVPRKISIGSFPYLTVFELNLKIFHFCSSFGPPTNQKQFKHRFQRFINCYVLKKHRAAILEKLEAKLCGKENSDGKWGMTVNNWEKVKLLYSSSINKLFNAFYMFLFLRC